MLTPPTERDITFIGRKSDHKFNLNFHSERQKDGHNEWCYASLNDVKRRISSAGYPDERTHYVKGDVLQTIKVDSHKAIALLRLDTDWYDSSKHELEMLYDAVVPGGIIILDDYGSWKSQYDATNDYFTSKGLNGPLLIRTSWKERVIIKC